MIDKAIIQPIGLLVNLNFTVENYAIKLIYDQTDTAHADMCFSNITITHSIFQKQNMILYNYTCSIIIIITLV